MATTSKFLDLAQRRILPAGQPHLGLVGIGTVVDDFSGCLPVDGPMQLVLHCGEEALRGLRRHVVVNGRGVNVGDLLVELSLREANLADALELLFEILLGEHRTTGLDALIVHHVGLDGELLDDARGPLAELHRTLGIDLVAYGDDGGKAVVLGVVALAVSGSYSKFSNH